MTWNTVRKDTLQIVNLTLPRQSDDCLGSDKLEMKLLQMLGGELETAYRLIAQVKTRHPGRSEQWYWEKVIYDLERDYC